MTALEEAVQEIERLKAELIDARVRGNAFCDVAKKFKEENERLRNKIEEASNQLYVDSDGIGSVKKAREILDEALDAEQGGE